MNELAGFGFYLVGYQKAMLRMCVCFLIGSPLSCDAMMMTADDNHEGCRPWPTVDVAQHPLLPISRTVAWRASMNV